MYFTLYDRNLTSIGQTYILEYWERTRRAVDFDDMSITGEQIPYTADPFFVVINDDKGHMKFSGLASTPDIDEKTKKTKIQLKDYTTLFNSDIVVNWSQFNGTTVSELLSFVFNIWKSQNGSIGFSNIVIDVSSILNILLDDDLPLGSDKESVLAYNLILDCMQWYNLWCEPTLDVSQKKLTFKFRRAANYTVDVQLKDFDIQGIKKSFGDFNQATIYDYQFNKNQTWILTTDNEVVKLPSLSTPVYPMKNRNYIAQEPSDDLSAADAINNAVYEAVMALVENRYQEEFNLDLNAYKVGEYLKDLDFSAAVRVYTDDGYYKTLPVGEIQTDSNNKHILTIGYRVQEITQEI